MDLIIRKAKEQDLASVLTLYSHLHPDDFYNVNDITAKVWQNILADPKITVLLGCAEDIAAASCTLIIIDNLTRGNRPYAIVENVVTLSAYRKRGFATALLKHAKEIATGRNCYKIMLMTSSKEASTLNFYRNAGYNSNDKTAFVQWL